MTNKGNKKDFTSNIQVNIEESTKETVNQENEEVAADMVPSTGFTIKKKTDDKAGKKPTQVYFETETLKSLDKVSKKAGYSRNEMINKMIEHCLATFKLEE